MIKPLDQTPTISHVPTTKFQQDRKEEVVPIKGPQRKLVEKLCQAPNHVNLDANGSKDLAEYVTRANIALESSTTADGKIIFLETQESADLKFTQYLKDPSEENLLHGDRFLQDLLQADITELETEPKLSKVLFGRKKDILPILVLSKQDSTGQLSEEDEFKYKSLLNDLFKLEITNYLKEAPKDRVADDYTERIRRILRTNARLIDENSLPRNLSGAWQNEANRGRIRAKRLSLTLGTFTALSTIAAVIFTNDNQHKDRIIVGMKTDAKAKDHTLRGFRGESVFDKGFHATPASQEKIVDRLKDNEEGVYLDKIINEVLAQCKADKDFYSGTTKVLVSIPIKRNENKIFAMRKDDLLHIAIPQTLLQEMFNYITTNHTNPIDEEVKFLVSSNLKKEKQKIYYSSF